jgi:hypothetical protein
MRRSGYSIGIMPNQTPVGSCKLAGGKLQKA